MTQFEFISVAVSIVLGLSAARLLSAVPYLLAPGRRYWVHVLWSAMLLAGHLGFWWAIWIYRDVDPWTFSGFAAVMLTPALLYLTVSALVSDRPAMVESWRTHFFARHRVFFSLFLALTGSGPLRQFAVLGHVDAPFIQGAVPPMFLVFLIPMIAVTGIVASNERIHALLVLVAAGLVLVTTMWS